MDDINNPRLLWLKFSLFVFVGFMATAIALFSFPFPKLACLMALAIWAFCRAYYFVAVHGFSNCHSSTATVFAVEFFGDLDVYLW
jgi:hypothetical protein